MVENNKKKFIPSENVVDVYLCFKLIAKQKYITAQKLPNFHFSLSEYTDTHENYFYFQMFLCPGQSYRQKLEIQEKQDRKFACNVTLLRFGNFAYVLPTLYFT